MQIELRQRRLERGEKTDGETHSARGAEHVDAQTRSRDCSGKIARAPLEEVRPEFLADQLARHREQLSAGYGLAHAPELAEHAQAGGQAGFEMEIAGLRRAACCDEGGEFHASRVTASNSRRHAHSLALSSGLTRSSSTAESRSCLRTAAPRLRADAERGDLRLSAYAMNVNCSDEVFVRAEVTILPREHSAGHGQSFRRRYP